MKLTTLENIAEISSGRGLKDGAKPDGNGFYVVGMADVTSEREEIDWSGVKKADIVLRSHKPLHDGDILFLAKGNLNKAVVVTGLSENAVASHHFFIIRPKQHVDSRFIAMALNNAAARGYFQSIARGESKKHITKQDLGNFELAKFEKSEESVMIKLMTDADNRFQKMYSQRECFQKAWDLFVQQKSAQALSVLEKIRNFDEQYLSREVEGLVALINATELDPKGKRRQPPKI